MLAALNLPEDYSGLTAEGRRKARVHAVQKQGPTPDDFVRAWVFFRTYYLRQLPPGVFYKEYAESPPFHYDLVRDIAAWRLNAWACPRGHAKSTVLGTEIPLMLALSRPNFEILLILAKENMVQRRVGKLMNQYETNSYILEDFGPMKPPRGAKIWNHSILQLQNGSSIVGMPVEGKLLGERPDLILNDDPEHDKALAQNPNPVYLREAFERLLWGTLMPMLRVGAALGWIGTLLDMRSFLYQFIHSKESHITKFWNRRNLAGWVPTGEGDKTTPLWESRWSKKEFQEVEESMPAEYFATHFMNQPGMGVGGSLKVHPQFCTYRVEPEVDWSVESPLQCESKLVSHRAIRVGSEDGESVNYQPEELVQPFGDAVRAMRRVITVDRGFSLKASADYSVIHTLGYQNDDTYKDTLWSLDLWMGHLKLSAFVPLLWSYAHKWRAYMIAVEAVAQQEELIEPIREYMQRHREHSWNWVPIVVPVKYPAGVPKPNRIESTLSWRFDRFRVKLPTQRRNVWPYRELFGEIDRFDISMKGLQHDDAIDSLTMYQYIKTGKPRTGPKEPGEARVDPIEAIKRGELVDDVGIPYLSQLTPDQYPVEALRKQAMDEHERDQRENGGVVWRVA